MAIAFDSVQHSTPLSTPKYSSLLLLLQLFLPACLPSSEPSSFIASAVNCVISSIRNIRTQSINRMDHHTGYFHDSYTPPSKGHSSSSHVHPPPSSSSSSAYSSSDDDDDSSSTSSYDSELLELQAAEREWEENVRQLQLAVSVLILPTIGKWLGRRWSYFRRFLLILFLLEICGLPSFWHVEYFFSFIHDIVYARYIQVGWSWNVLLPEKWISKRWATWRFLL